MGKVSRNEGVQRTQTAAVIALKEHWDREHANVHVAARAEVSGLKEWLQMLFPWDL